MPNSPKVILITGCSSGIGAALAEEFHHRGHIVYASARRLDSLTSLTAKGLRALSLDVTDPASIAAAVAVIEAEQGGLDLLINNAGFSTIGPVIDIGSENLRRQFETNVISPIAMVRAALSLLERRRGCVVNVGSIVGLVGVPFRGAYGASKAALHILSDALRMELRPFGIRVVTVQPGGVQSSIADKATAIDLGTSRYAPIAAAIDRDRHISQLDAMPAPVFARLLAQSVLRPHPPAIVRLGTKSTLLPALKRFLPLAWLDHILSSRFGLDGLKR